MFDETKLYMANDPALDVLGTPSTRAHWRSDRSSIGSRVAYKGADLNAWIESRTVTRLHN